MLILDCVQSVDDLILGQSDTSEVFKTY